MAEAIPIFPPTWLDEAVGAWLIQLADAEALPSYFSLSEARQTAAMHAWTTEAGKALQFTRDIDAANFAARYLQNMNIRVVRR